MKIKLRTEGFEKAPLTSGLSGKTVSSSFFLLHSHPGHRFLDLHRKLRESRFSQRLNLEVSRRIPTLVMVKMGIHDP